MIKKYLLHTVMFLTLVTSCGSRQELSNFDYDTWVSDPNGCSGRRLAIQPSLERNLESLKTLNQNEVKELLGKPDKNELYKRSQKFFIYQIGPGEECGLSLATPSPYLSIRFNAMGLAKEVLIYNK
ncbi:MAG: hypothetical protein AAGF85_11310 [Bacteroidota bacterium]